MQIEQGYRPGCIGQITAMHAAYYSAASGFGLPFETKVASELAAFCLRYNPAHDGIWLATVSERIEAAIVIDGAAQAQHGAHLRWFITSEQTRGTGIGTRLLQTALNFCDQRGYASTYLWTFDELAPARHLYLKHGFTLEHSQRGAQWGREVTEQRYRRRLSQPNLVLT